MLPHVYAFAMRGPQIAFTDKGIIVTACTSDGNIYSLYKENSGSWKQGNKVNVVDTVAKEGLMALNADGANAFVVWLDLRGNKRNKIYGAKSVEGGKTWSRNMLIYASPDSTVCECCKPSVYVKGQNVYDMFRNWLNGNRDLYLVQSANAGTTFGNAQKLGKGSWKLNGCLMDGGGLTVNDNGEAQTVWRRESAIYFDQPGTAEKKIGEGRNCTIETMSNKNVYAWTENENIVITEADDKKKELGKGTLPVIKSVGSNKVLCIWQHNKEIKGGLIKL
jgi:hypothetical protein